MYEQDDILLLEPLWSKTMTGLYLELVCLATIIVLSYVMVHAAGFTCSVAAFHYISPPTSGANPLTPGRSSKHPGLDHLTRVEFGLPRWHDHLLFSPRKTRKPVMLFDRKQ